MLWFFKYRIARVYWGGTMSSCAVYEVEGVDDTVSFTPSAIETATVVLRYAELCQRMRESDAYDGEYMLNVWAKSSRIADASTKSAKAIGGVMPNVGELYGIDSDEFKDGYSSGNSWNLNEIVDETTPDPRTFRERIEDQYDITVDDYLVEGEEKTTWWRLGNIQEIAP